MTYRKTIDHTRGRHSAVPEPHALFLFGALAIGAFWSLIVDFKINSIKVGYAEVDWVILNFVPNFQRSECFFCIASGGSKQGINIRLKGSKDWIKFIIKIIGVLLRYHAS